MAVNLKSRALNIRVYSKSVGLSKSHSYCVDDFQTGTSPLVGSIYVDPTSVTFSDLRNMLEYSRERGMNKRSVIFQEVLFIMNRLPNVFEKSADVKFKYALGFIEKGTGKIEIIPFSAENSSISSQRPGLSNYDIAIIPVTQIDSATELNLYKDLNKDNDEESGI